jgi:hypothetical protein
MLGVPSPAFVTLFVFRVTRSHVSAHECWGDQHLFVGEVTVPRPRLPSARPGDRVRLRIGERCDARGRVAVAACACAQGRSG